MYIVLLTALQMCKLNTTRQSNGALEILASKSSMLDAIAFALKVMETQFNCI